MYFVGLGLHLEASTADLYSHNTETGDGTYLHGLAVALLGGLGSIQNCWLISRHRSSYLVNIVFELIV